MSSASIILASEKKMLTKASLVSCFLLCSLSLLFAQKPTSTVYLLKPAQVFDGESMHPGWVVLVRNERIAGVGPAATVSSPPEARTIDLTGATLMPGLIEAHSHVLLHPYNETSWNDQNAHESLALRVARATVHLQRTLMAGFTTIRDLGTEGAAYSDVGLKQAVEQGIIPGPRMLVVTKAIVATGSYGPKGFAAEWSVPQGAEEASGNDVIRVVRDQIGHGADWIKIYADYRWGLGNEAAPTFSEEEIRMMVETARSSGRAVAAHATTAEGMRRAVMGGVETIEHGDNGTAAVFRLMKEKGVSYIPTLSVGANSEQKKAVFKLALASGVTIGNGSDVGVFPHGDEAREIELMGEFGMPALGALKAATSVNAKILHMDDRIGRLKESLLADLIAIDGDPSKNLASLHKVTFVMKNGSIYKQ
jgi:imidazolonepropionase-like amidohydrolase